MQKTIDMGIFSVYKKKKRKETEICIWHQILEHKWEKYERYEAKTDNLISISFIPPDHLLQKFLRCWAKIYLILAKKQNKKKLT